jgi:hypothetical protein
MFIFIDSSRSLGINALKHNAYSRRTPTQSTDTIVDANIL